MRHVLQTYLMTFWLMAFPIAAMAQEQTIVEPFLGSEAVGQYVVEFDQLTLLTDDQGEETFARQTIEGIVRATALTGPEDKSALEIFRSFENALSEAGFDILFARQLQRDRRPPEGQGSLWWVRELRDFNDNRAYERIEGRNGLSLIRQHVYIQPDFYLSARRETPTEETFFALTISADRNYYLMEEVSRAVMAEDTVTISEAGVTSGIAAEGKAILYGVQFDVGSAVLRPDSSASMEVIANVLRENEGDFYVVGHTSDTGSFELNMRLSQDRAAAIIETLARDYGINADRLQPIGVGPAAPLASNLNEAGRQLNRRVELVERLPQ